MSCWEFYYSNNLWFELGTHGSAAEGKAAPFLSLPYLKTGSRFLRATGRAEARAKEGSETPAESLKETLGDT